MFSSIAGKSVFGRIVLRVWSMRRLRKIGVSDALIQASNRTFRKNGFIDGLECAKQLRKLHKSKKPAVRFIPCQDQDTFRLVLETYPKIVEHSSELIEDEIERTGDSEFARRTIEFLDISCEDPVVIEYAHKRIQNLIGERHKSYQSRDKPFDRSSAPQVLLDFKTVLDKAGKRFFLSSGTLLGVVRENGFIASDYDIDVGVFANELGFEECARLFKSSKFEVLTSNKYIVCLRHKSSRIDFDIFFYHEDEGMLFHGSDIHKWWTRKFELMSWNFSGSDFYVPADVEKVLEDLYGNWRKPVLFYDLSYDCPYRSYNHTLEGILYVYTRAMNAFSNRWRYYSDKGAEGLRDFFSIDFSRHIAAPINHHNIPFPPNRFMADGKGIVILHSDFSAAVNCELVKCIQSYKNDQTYLVLAVMPPRKSGGMNAAQQQEKAALLRSLNCVDAVFVCQTQSEFSALVEEMRASRIFPLKTSVKDIKSDSGLRNMQRGISSISPKSNSKSAPGRT